MSTPFLKINEACSDFRDLTQLIERERKDGFPICAATNMNSHGYYLAVNQATLAKEGD